MPVKFDGYHSNQEVDLSEGTYALTILSFLATYPEFGFTPQEIHEATDVPKANIRSTLRRLEEKRLVRHKDPYWAAAESDRLAAYVRQTTQLETEKQWFDDQCGQRPDWAEELER